MALALFDLDNTLLSGDSDYEWGQFLVSKKLVDADVYDQANKKFYEDYKQGTLDIVEFCAFTFTFLSTRTMKELKELHQSFMQERIIPLMGDKAKALIEHHKKKGDTLVIITATNSFITKPIADAFGIEYLIATEAEIIDGKYTTKIAGTPCFKEGKVTRLNEWLKSNNYNMKDSVFYSDSHNDLPLLELASTAVAVDPDEILSRIATQQGWGVVSLRWE